MTKAKEGAKKGRPSVYSDHLADHIAERLSTGETLTKICSEEEMPTIRTIQLWMGRNPDFFALITRAREAGAEWLVGDLHNRMTKLVQVEEGNPLPEKAEVDAMRLYSQHIQWMTSRWNPKRYSERVLAELAKIPEPIAPPEPDIDPKLLSYEERELYLQLQETARKRRESLLIEHQEEEETNDGSDEGAGDDQSGDPASR